MDVHAAVAEQVEIAVEFDDLLPSRQVLADGRTQRGKVGGDVGSGVARCRPEGGADFVALIHDRRIRELADITGVVEMKVPEHNVFHVVGLYSDLLELAVDSDVR